MDWKDLLTLISENTILNLPEASVKNYFETFKTI